MKFKPSNIQLLAALLAGVLSIGLSSLLSSDNSCTRGGCRETITVKLAGASKGNLSSLELTALPKEEKDDEYIARYKFGKGSTYTFTLQPPSEGGCSATFTTCSGVFFTKSKNADKSWSKGWQFDSNPVLSSSRYPASKGGGSGPPCGCKGCNSQEGCKCCCYTAEVAGTSTTYPKYTKYKAWTEKTESVSIGEDDDATNILSSYQNRANFLRFDVSGTSVTAVYKDMDNLTEKSLPENGSPDDFVSNVEPPDMITETTPGSPAVSCNCHEQQGSNQDDQSSSQNGQDSGPNYVENVDEMQIMVWEPASSSKSDLGESNMNGVSEGGGEPSNGPESSPPGVPLGIDFGLGRSASGFNPAAYSFTAQVDSANPFAAENFDLLQPFAEPGEEPIKVSLNPEAGVSRRLVGMGIIVDEIRAEDGASIQLVFKNAADQQVAAVHTLERVVDPETSLPGIRYSVVKNGQTRVTVRYGQSDASGARIWKEVAEDGTIEEGSSIPYDLSASAPVRVEVHRNKKLVNGALVTVDQTTEKYRKYAFGERLVEHLVTDPNGGESVTSYEYFEQGAAAGQLKWYTSPDGSWERYEYDPQSGKRTRVLRPWLSSVTNPVDATYNNSAATTYSEVSAGEHWTIESVEGKVTSRKWERRETNQLDPLAIATTYAWKMRLWRTQMPASVHAGDQMNPGRPIALVRLDQPQTRLLVGNYGGSISQTIEALMGGNVTFNDGSVGQWEQRSKSPPATMQVQELKQLAAKPAVMVIQCNESQSNDSITLGVGTDGGPTFTLDLTTQFSGGTGGADVAVALYNYLMLNATAYWDINLDEPSATVTLSTKASGSGEAITASAVGSTFTPDSDLAAGTDDSQVWAVITTCSWSAQAENWQTGLGMGDQVPASRNIAVALATSPSQRTLVADNGGSIAQTVSAITGRTVVYDGAAGKWLQNGQGTPAAFSVQEYQLIAGQPERPAQPEQTASLTILCNDSYYGDTLSIASGSGSSVTFVVGLDLQEGDGQAVAASLASLLQGSFSQEFNVSFSDRTVTITTLGGGTNQSISVGVGSNYGTFFPSTSYVTGQDATPFVAATADYHAWIPIAYSNWMQLPPASPAGQTSSNALSNLNLFNGTFDSLMTQTFTADYSFWDGHMELRDASTANDGKGDLRRVVDSKGLVTMYSYDRGSYHADARTFNWNQTGQAVKVTKRRFAANPATFELLEEDPVFNVSMQDYQGLTRKEQTWKGSAMVAETVHDYNSATRDRLSSKEGEVLTFRAVRDTSANTLTQTDATGTSIRITYTPTGEVLNTAKLGHGGRPDLISVSLSDGMTRTNTTAAGGLTRFSSSTQNAKGQTVSSIDENGLLTAYAYELNGRRIIETRPDGGTVITENYLDDRLKSISGTGRVAEFHTYSVDASGNMTETVYLNDNGTGAIRSPRWQSSTTNGLGWIVAEARPAPSAVGGAAPGVLLTKYVYNSKGQRIRTERTGQKNLLSAYDSFGRVSAQGTDLNSDNQLTVADAITATQTSFEQMGGNWFEKTVITETASNDNSAPLRARTSFRLLGGALYSSAIEYTSDGLVTTTATSTSPASKTVTTVVTTNRSSQCLIRTVVNGLLLSESGQGGTGATTYDYDALERPTLVEDTAGIRRRRIYADLENGTARSFILREEVQASGASAYTTERSYSYHPAGSAGAGRVATLTQADANTVSYSYDLQGRQTFIGGTATYPVRYVYDEFGDLWQMHTYRNGTPTATSNGDVTTWNRDPASGVLLSKTDAAAQGSTLAYDPATGRLQQRTLARRGADNSAIRVTYLYDLAGRLWMTNYSDDTPDVTHTYYADGQLKTTTDAAGLHTYAYNGPNGLLSGESITGGLLGGSSWSTTFESSAKLRDVYTWSWAGVGSRSIDYDYDGAGRLEKVSAFGHSATYGYEAATGRKSTLAYSGAGLMGTWSHDLSGRLDAIQWQAGGSVLSKHDYSYDGMNRRTAAERETGETWRYGYNTRGEVESAVKKVDETATAAAKRGLQSGYGYDLIGNRIMDKQHTPSSGNGLSEAVWTANALNQITARENHDSRWVFGHVKQEATLTVSGNSDAVIRDGNEFAVPVSRTGAATSADWHSLDVTATLPGAGRMQNGAPLDVTTQKHGKVWFPTSPESLQYDEDGNLTQDGRWNYTWNAENRLKAIETRADAATGMPRQRLEFAYDAQGRRIRKAVYQLETSNLEPATWVLKNDLRFLYEGLSWNLAAEIEMSPGLPVSSSPRLVRAYAWGTDISGTITGAGGVGGLLFVQRAGNVAEAPCHDGNGNISAYVRVATGAVTSRHDYDAFGRPVWNELEGTGGRQMAASPFGFSTKYTDVETGWCYYGYRFYSPELGRWPSEDPIGEQGGINLYGMVANDPVNSSDELGLKPNNQDVKCTIVLMIGHGYSSSLPHEVNVWLNDRIRMSQADRDKFPAYFIYAGCGTGGLKVYPGTTNWPGDRLRHDGGFIGMATERLVGERFPGNYNNTIHRADRKWRGWRWQTTPANAGWNPDTSAKHTDSNPNDEKMYLYHSFNQAIGFAHYVAELWNIVNETGNKIASGTLLPKRDGSSCCPKMRVLLRLASHDAAGTNYKNIITNWSANGNGLLKYSGLTAQAVNIKEINSYSGKATPWPNVPKFPAGDTTITHTYAP
jgi:RHS repeat-associated protein